MIAPLLAEYAKLVVDPTRPYIDDVLTTAPLPFLSISLITYLFNKNIPVWFTEITLFHSSILTSCGLLALPPIPALATK